MTMLVFFIVWVCWSMRMLAVLFFLFVFLSKSLLFLRSFFNRHTLRLHLIYRRSLLRGCTSSLFQLCNVFLLLVVIFFLFIIILLIFFVLFLRHLHELLVALMLLLKLLPWSLRHSIVRVRSTRLHREIILWTHLPRLWIHKTLLNMLVIFFNLGVARITRCRPSHLRLLNHKQVLGSFLLESKFVNFLSRPLKILLSDYFSLPLLFHLNFE